MPKSWKLFGDEMCEVCGCCIEILTDDSLPEGFAHDSDDVRCPRCGATGWMTADEDSFYPNFNEENDDE